MCILVVFIILLLHTHTGTMVKSAVLEIECLVQITALLLTSCVTLDKLLKSLSLDFLKVVVRVKSDMIWKAFGIVQIKYLIKLSNFYE